MSSQTVGDGHTPPSPLGPSASRTRQPRALAGIILRCQRPSPLERVSVQWAGYPVAAASGQRSVRKKTVSTAFAWVGFPVATDLLMLGESTGMKGKVVTWRSLECPL